MATIAETLNHDEFRRLSAEDKGRYNFSIADDQYVLLAAKGGKPFTYEGQTGTEDEQPELPGIEATLEERGGRYGIFANHAEIAQNIQDAMRNSPNWQLLPPDMKQAMQVIADKCARCLNGDFTYDDNWRDIIGYATLILNRLTDDQKAKQDS